MIKEPNFYYKKQKIDQIIKNYKSNRKNLNSITHHYAFEDEFFKSDLSTIITIDKYIRINKILGNKDIVELNKFKYMRISEMDVYKQFLSKEKKKESAHGIDCAFNNKFVDFGQYGNYNLYNSLIFLSQNKTWKKNIFIRSDFKRKLFVVKLYIQGRPKSILIDDKIPVKLNEEAPVPAFLHCSDNFYISLIEKALAKVKGSYGNTIRALSSEIFPYLIDCTIKTIPHNTNRRTKLWEVFNEACKKNWIIFSEYESISLESYNNEMSLSYFVMSIFKISKVKYVELAVPERNEGFENTKQKLQCDIVKNSIFFENYEKPNRIFMKFENFHKTFQKTFIVQCEEDVNYHCKKISCTGNKFNLVKFRVNKTSKVSLTLHYTNIEMSRMILIKVRNSYDRINGRHCSLNLNTSVKDQSNSMQTEMPNQYIEDNEFSFDYVDAAYARKDKLVLEQTLEEGLYYILFKIYSEKIGKVVLSSYSTNYLQFDEHLEESDYKLINQPEILGRCLNNFFSEFVDYTGTSQLIENDPYLIYKYSLVEKNFGFSVMKFDNISSDRVVYVGIDYENSGMNLLSHSNSKLNDDVHYEVSNRSTRIKTISLKIPPLCHEVVVFEWIKNMNEISINISPRFRVETLNPKLHETDLMKKPRTFITSDIYYYEISYRKGVYIILVNESKVFYIVNLEFEKLENLIIADPTGYEEENLVSLDLNARSKSCVNLRLIKEGDISYKLNFQLKRVNKI